MLCARSGRNRSSLLNVVFVEEERWCMSWCIVSNNWSNNSNMM